MKTGQFANKYDLTPNGIRYYIEQGLLTPKKKGAQYDFDDECIVQMEKIQELKQMHFTLGEISRIFHTRGLIQHTLNPTARKKYNRIFLSKIDELEMMIEDLQRCIDDLEQSVLPIDKAEKELIVGLPIGRISMLRCPVCGKEFDFDGTEIRRGRITSGKLSCRCGYKLDIFDGILINPQENTRQMNIEWSNLLNLLSEYSTEYVNLEANSYYQLKSELQKELESRGCETFNGTVFTTGGYAGDFICKYHNMFQPGSLFIVADQSIDVLRYIKEKIGRLNNVYDIIYICDNAFDLPLKKGSIEFFLDDYSSSEFIFYNPVYPLEKIRPLLKENAICAGVFTYYSHSAKTLQTIRKDYAHADIPHFFLDTFKRHLRSSGVTLETERMIGNTKDPGTGAAFDYHAAGDILHFYTYYGHIKKDRSLP